MAKSQETSNKKDLEKKKLQKKKEKEQRREERKAAAKEGKSFEDMLAYVDENGNITSTPPDPTKKKVIKEEDIVIGVRRKEPGEEVEAVRKGKVTFFNTSKGYGFIKDLKTQESIFVHINAVSTPIQENDTVTFETEMGPKGLNAIKVKVV
ncbi:MAG TPA: cold shock domain-containing protein [Ohtaekwangia sp.]